MVDWLLTLKAMLLGIIEGLTEFLPVSSTGHLIIFGHLLDFSSHEAFANMFTMVIQLGAILAVIVLYRDQIIHTLVHLFPDSTTNWRECGLYFWLMIGISCIPAAAIGIPLDEVIEAKLFNPLVVSCSLFLGGLWMLYAESKLRSTNTTSLSKSFITPKAALIIGLFQVLSLIPGVSRSASTIIGGWVAGLSTVAAAEYSFFLAIPVMFGQGLLNLLDVKNGLMPAEWIALAVGFVTSFIIALLVIKSFISYLQKKKMSVFAIYRIILAFILLAFGSLNLL